jgi:hypothetical protein
VSTLFNAPVHVKHLTELFESLSFDEVADFVVCQVADSTNLNPKIAKDLGYPHVGCHDHCLTGQCSISYLYLYEAQVQVNHQVEQHLSCLRK